MSLANATDFASAAGLSTAGGGGGVTVDFDLTALYMVGLFLVLWLVLKPLLFDPMLHLFEERERRTLGAKLLARKIDEQSAGALTKYETEMGKARTSANAERDKLRAEGSKEESEILARVRATTAKTVDEARKKLQGELVGARAQIATDSQAIARDLATRALGREVH